MQGLNQIVRNLTVHYNRKISGLVNLCDVYGKSVLESDAKRNAPWKDRTGNARNGLFGGATKQGTIISTYVAHKMDYGKYLEHKNGGEYAILNPTIRKNKRDFYNKLNRYWSG